MRVEIAVGEVHVLQQVNNLYGFTVRGTDGDIGRVRGVFYPNQSSNPQGGTAGKPPSPAGDRR